MPRWQVSTPYLTGQVNLKSQYPMTKTFAKIAAHHDIKPGEPIVKPLEQWQPDPLVGFLDLDHWDLFGI
jgi:hypothetical protein